MKRTFTKGFIFAVCLAALTSCHKEVKKPVGKVPESNAKSSTTTYTGTQTQSSHTCPGSSNTSGNEHP